VDKLTIAILYRPEIKEFDFGPGHPCRGDRFEAFYQFLKENLPEDDNYRIIPADWATDDDLQLICHKEYIDFTREYYRAANLGLKTSDSFSQYHSLDNRPIGRPGKVEEAARLAIGQAKLAADLVQAGKFQKAVCIGGNMHHANPTYGEGFCLYNDNAFVAKYLMTKYGLNKILLLDTDAHQGNGTCAYFYSDPRVLFIDLHQDPRTLYPGTGFASEIGEGEGRGYTINVPLPPYAGLESYRFVFDEMVLPVTEEFKPDIIIRIGGSDPHFADNLTHLGLTAAGFRMIGEKVRQMDEVCYGKHIDNIGSGYNIQVLPNCWLALICGLAGFNIEVKEPIPVPEMFQTDHSLEMTRQVVAEVKGYLKDYWKCLR
jgi:acetoin utilization protein AcuC